VAYERNGQRVEWPDMDADALEASKPIYEHLPGWNTNTNELRRGEDLPGALRDYIGYISRAVGVPVGLISVGPDSGATVVPA
jgi:adenylosuccinate synthase